MKVIQKRHKTIKYGKKQQKVLSKLEKTYRAAEPRVAIKDQPKIIDKNKSILFCFYTKGLTIVTRVNLAQFCDYLVDHQ